MSKRISRRVTAVVLVSAIVLSNSILPVTQAHAVGPTVNGQWSNNCTVFTVTSTYPVDTQSILDVYQSGAMPGMNVKDVSYSGTAYLAQPLVFNTANGTKGFTIQVDNTTILTTQTCATISAPTVTMTPLTCNTVSFSGTSGNMDYETFYPRSVRIKKYSRHICLPKRFRARRYHQRRSNLHSAYYGGSKASHRYELHC